MMAITLPSTPAERFAAILGLLRDRIAAHSARNLVLAPVFMLVWSRVSRIAQRFAHLAARIPPDAPPRPHRTLSRAARPETARRERAQNRFAGLPRRTGWLLRLAPAAVAPARSQLQYLLADEEMRRLLDASPGARRLIRPLCRMLLLTPPPPPEPPEPEPLAPKPVVPKARRPDPPAPRSPTRQGAPPDPSDPPARCGPEFIPRPGREGARAPVAMTVPDISESGG